MKKPILVLVPPPPKAAPGEVQWIPFDGELEPTDSTKGLALVERKAPYRILVRVPSLLSASPTTPLDE